MSTTPERVHTMSTAPALAIGQAISGKHVIAAIKEADKPGYLPGLHVVTAEDDRELVTWEVAWQAGYGWVANAGHYFTHEGEASQRLHAYRQALTDMTERVTGR
jgi:hypothetical protein